MRKLKTCFFLRWALGFTPNGPLVITPNSTSKAHLVTRYSRKTDNFVYFW